MSISILTNSVANGAVRNFNDVQNQLDVVTDRVSSALKVGSAKQDASTFSIAQDTRTKIRGLDSIIQGLNTARGISKVAIVGAEAVSNLFNELKTTILEATNPINTPETQRIYQEEYSNILSQMRSIMSNCEFNNKNILIEEDFGGTNQFSRFPFTLNDTEYLSGISGETVLVRGHNLDMLVGIMEAQSVNSIANANTALATLDTPANEPDPLFFFNGAGRQYNNNGPGGIGDPVRSPANLIADTLNFLSQDLQTVNKLIDNLTVTRDALLTGLGEMVDADMSREAAMLTAVQVRKDLAAEALSQSNSGSKFFLDLFE